MTPEFRAALGGLARIPQFFIYRLEWDGAEGKYKKYPWHATADYKVSPGDPANWMSYDDAVACVQRRRAGLNGVLTYALGFWMTEDTGYWFLDLDKCATGGQLNAQAQALLDRFPGCMVEWSSSGNGVHVFGRGRVPPHRTKPTADVAAQLAPMGLEFYTRDRGVAFGLQGQASGLADTDGTAGAIQVVATYLPAREDGGVDVGARRPEWRGPDDDEELLRRALNARASAEVAFGGKASFRDLWEGNVEHGNEADMALASHLAFWTGCDVDRMERLMKRSGLAREKWQTHRTYLRELTITNACRQCQNVYQEAVKSTAAQSEMYGAPVTVTRVQGEVVNADVMKRIEELLDMVSACGTFDEMHNVVIPTCRDAGLPLALAERIVQGINKKLDLWNGKLPVGKLRALICPPTVQGSAGAAVPEWAQRHCYVQELNAFYDLASGVTKSRDAFNAEFNRMMPLKENGTREDASKWCLDRWNMSVVAKIAYRPDQPEYFVWDGIEHVNSYAASSVPAAATEWTQAGVAGINAFREMLWDMSGRREEVFNQLLSWMAHNVQKPGVKVRWSPLIKGCQGDGKSLVTEVLRCAMGHRNCNVTSNATLCASGGFTDWAMKAAVNVIEEIMLTGKERHRLYNAMKEFITNNVININPKGKTTYVAYNCSNHLALTNHNDAIPLEAEDRRWMVMFTPWATLQEMAEYCGVDVDARFALIDHAYKHCAGEFRAWFLSLPLDAGFRVNGPAPRLEERASMRSSSEDDAEQVVRNIIDEGAAGVDRRALCSASLAGILKLKAMTENFEIPSSKEIGHILTRLGYSRVDLPIWWNGKTRRTWVKNGVKPWSEEIRKILDKTCNASSA